MSGRSLIALLLTLSLSPLASMAADAPAAANHATGPQDVRRIELMHDIPAYLDRLNETVMMAKKGEYGRLSRHDKERVEAAQSQITLILRDRTDDSGLTEDQRLEIFNAQELIAGILRADEDNRIVCTHEQVTGTRLTSSECLTVGQRKARAAHAREEVQKIQDKGLLGGVAQ